MEKNNIEDLKETLNSYLKSGNLRVEVEFFKGGKEIKQLIISKAEENGTIEGIEDTYTKVYVEKRNIEVKVTEIINEMGIPAHISGYRYLRQAIIMAYDDVKLIHHITKELYPKIAKKNKVTVSRVERAMRYAIENVWVKGNKEKIDEIFGYTIVLEKGKPTNSEFIATIVDYLKLNYNQFS